jgi:hypothetical protein
MRIYLMRNRRLAPKVESIDQRIFSTGTRSAQDSDQSALDSDRESLWIKTIRKADARKPIAQLGEGELAVGQRGEIEELPDERGRKR